MTGLGKKVILADIDHYKEVLGGINYDSALVLDRLHPKFLQNIMEAHQGSGQDWYLTEEQKKTLFKC